MTFEEPVYRPPWEARSMLLAVSQSCNWNRCKFCYRSKDYPFKVADSATFRRELLMQKSFYPADTRIFFVGSNNFALPTHRLMEFLDIVNEELPDHGRISMFSRVDAIARKSDEELAQLVDNGCTHLYVGTESGNNDALKLMDKGHTTDEAVEQLLRLDKAGISYTLFYILGLGGKGAGEKSGRETAEFFNRVHPKRISSTGMTVTEGTGAWDMWRAGEYEKASEREMIEELRVFLETLDIPCVYDSYHMLNPVHIKLDTGDEQAKVKAIAQIDEVLNTYSDEQLAAAVNRPMLEESCKPEYAA